MDAFLQCHLQDKHFTLHTGYLTSLTSDMSNNTAPGIQSCLYAVLPFLYYEQCTRQRPLAGLLILLKIAKNLAEQMYKW